MRWAPARPPWVRMALARARPRRCAGAYLLAHREDASLVYGGNSAGAVVVTPTLKGIELVDPSAVLASGYGS